MLSGQVLCWIVARGNRSAKSCWEIQVHGAVGDSQETPLASWYTHIRSQRLVDAPDKVHRWTIGRNVIKAFQDDGTTAAAAGGDLI